MEKTRFQGENNLLLKIQQAKRTLPASTIKFFHMHLWGIDLGGTKIEGVVLESHKNPRVLARHRVPTEADQGYEHII
ncbi:MAG TPA: hypothetical protein PLW66_14600, partial [Saprospiraceae bacterium]|nr:hypothetical protein [Saprospiraceae bacterium]